MKRYTFVDIRHPVTLVRAMKRRLRPFQTLPNTGCARQRQRGIALCKRKDQSELLLQAACPIYLRLVLLLSISVLSATAFDDDVASMVKIPYFIPHQSPIIFTGVTSSRNMERPSICWTRHALLRLLLLQSCVQHLDGSLDVGWQASDCNKLLAATRNVSDLTFHKKVARE